MADPKAAKLSEDVLQSLSSTDYACSSLTPLSGGMANFIFKGTLTKPLPDGTKEVAVKHGEDYLAAIPAFLLPTTRCKAEVECLRALSGLPPTKGDYVVQTPKLYYSSPETNTQVQEYLPDALSLKHYALKHFSSPDPSRKPLCLELGRSLGVWLRDFHVWTSHPEQSGFREQAKANDEMRQIKHMSTYETLVSTVADFPTILADAKETFEKIRDFTAEELKNPALQVIHGDFWTGNVLLPSRPLEEGKQMPVFVVDWEVCQFNLPSFDLGQMIAELYELSLFKGIDEGKWLIEGFTAGYGHVDDEFAFRAALHIGTHLIAWGPKAPGWGSEAQVQQVVGVGKDIVLNAWRICHSPCGPGPPNSRSTGVRYWHPTTILRGPPLTGCISDSVSGISPITARSNGPVTIGGQTIQIDIRVGFWGLCFGPAPFNCTTSLATPQTKRPSQLAADIPPTKGGGNFALAGLALSVQSSFVVLGGIPLLLLLVAAAAANLAQVYFNNNTASSRLRSRERHAQAALWARALDWAAAAGAATSFAAYQAIGAAASRLIGAVAGVPLSVSVGSRASSLFAAVVVMTVLGALVNTVLAAMDVGFDAYLAARRVDGGGSGGGGAYPMTESTPRAEGSLSRPCMKCRVQEATLDSRSQPVCRDCFAKFIAAKCIKQTGILGKETRLPLPTTGGPPTGTRHYMVGLSLGISSTVLLHLLSENIEFQLARGRNAPFDLTVVHIDTATTTTPASPSPAETALSLYRTRYPRFTFHRIPLSTTTTTTSPEQNPHPYSPLPTAASRSDVTRLLTRRALLEQARARGCQALLLGHSTTALAELTLAEAAKGRGFALPWLGEESNKEDGEKAETDKGVLVYHPLRDALRKELVIYAGLVEPPLTELVWETRDDGAAAVVSHKDLSIEEVMGRYFAEVEESYPSVVANVARTTGKLVRAGEGEMGGEWCGLCGMPLDEDGDERWRGELGIQERSGTGTGRLCYGCERSTAG
ncbi:kinase-like domain-containing protein [Chaetomium sp. MPI-CAGE-AT-0009]|nr:kinase-like domain-containing protein [Chaetomium sp. MPI-CAGE-AT-0009]